MSVDIMDDMMVCIVIMFVSLAVGYVLGRTYIK